jgi:hypothetical protein
LYSEIITFKVNLYFKCSFTNSIVGKKRNKQSLDSSVGIVVGYWLDGQDSIPGTGKELFFYTASRLTMGPIQPPAQWVPGARFPAEKRPERDDDHSPPSSAEIKKRGAIPPLSKPLHGVVLNQLNPETPLPSPSSLPYIISTPI